MEPLSEQLYFFRPELTLAVTFLAAMVVEFAFKGKRIVTASVTLVGLAQAMIQLAVTYSGPRELFMGAYVIDPFSLFFKYLIIATAIVIGLFSLQSAELKRETKQGGEFFCLIAAVTLGMVLMSGAAHLIMMYLSLELVSLSSYVLAGFSKKERRSSEAALKYVIFGGVSSGIMLYGISILYGLTGSFDLETIRNVIASGEAISSAWSFSALIAATVMILAGFGYKISAVPFHFWTPDVYEGAPITVTAFLAVASKAAGFAMMIRFFTVTFFDELTGLGSWVSFTGVNWNFILAAVAVLTMTLGNVVAIWQDNLKRLLAYSSIAHAGYILTGVVAMSSLGLASVMVYFVVYFFMNLGAFYIVMVVADKLGSEHIDSYKGLGFRAPVIAVTFTIFLISLTGLPPTAGFIGKLYLFRALMDTDFVWLAVVLALNSVISLYYYVRVIRNMFLRDPEEGHKAPVAFSAAVVAVAVLFAVPNILLGLYFPQMVDAAQRSVLLFFQ